MPSASLTARINEVYTLTGRPDRVGETLLAVQNATLKAHHLDYFPRDLFEASFVCATSDFTQQIDATLLLGSRYRALHWMRKLDNTSGLNTGDYFGISTGDNALDAYGLDKLNFVYLAGNSWNIRTDVAWQYFSFGAFMSPDVTEDNYSSWVSDKVPAAITYEAARQVFSAIGNTEIAQGYINLVAEAYTEVAKLGVQLHGY